ncbi:hypothetical protein KKG83_04690 [Candidatus Micrarchaeota archaeon]|nr:hypothetical protein [Candidatus Micrarchaeota archaeon]MBU2476742.1 hypothetical protein [Candidatus Micrarchaeota archaeon]
MGTITLNVEDTVEEKFRKVTALRFGKKKGSLGKAASIAFIQWSDRHTKGSESRMLELLEKGFKMGKLRFKSRDELHER